MYYKHFGSEGCRKQGKKYRKKSYYCGCEIVDRDCLRTKRKMKNEKKI